MIYTQYNVNCLEIVCVQCASRLAVQSVESMNMLRALFVVSRAASLIVAALHIPKLVKGFVCTLKHSPRKKSVGLIRHRSDVANAVRPWSSLPRDIIGQLVSSCDSKSLGACRLVCWAWRYSIDSTLSELELSEWPERHSFVRKFPVVRALKIVKPTSMPSSPRGSCSNLASPSPREQVPAILEQLSTSTLLKSLAITVDGDPETLTGLQALGGLTSLQLIKMSSGKNSPRAPREPREELLQLPKEVTQLTSLSELCIDSGEPPYEVSTCMIVLDWGMAVCMQIGNQFFMKFVSMETDRSQHAPCIMHHASSQQTQHRCHMSIVLLTWQRNGVVHTCA